MGGTASYLTRNVFVVGRQPDVTYNPRAERHLEREVSSYLAQGPGEVLSISGPTKSGKTVLVERLLPEDEAIWIQGSDISDVGAFWGAIIDWLDLYDQVESATGATIQETGGGGVSAGIPGVLNLNVKGGGSTSTTDTTRMARQKAVAHVAREALGTVETPIVVDDFHYVAQEAKKDIARAIKSAVRRTSVVMIAVPHEAFDVVRSEDDMGGRISLLAIEHWTIDELMVIAQKGFDALRIVDDGAIGEALAQASYGAPFLMQKLCYEYAIGLGVLRTADRGVTAESPGDWADFFARVANRKPPMIFDALLEGPKTRGQERVQRVFTTGSVTDIYGALLYAIAQTGPSMTLRYQDIATVLERDLTVPIGGQQITSSLSHMSAIAEERRGDGDPAIAYKEDQLHILDPFLAFYLRHGDWDVSK